MPANTDDGGTAAPEEVRLNHEDDEEDEEEETGDSRVLEAWECAYANDQLWEALQEDESGLLRPINTKTIVHAQYHCRLLLRSVAATARIQKGLIRQLRRWIIVPVEWLLLRSHLFLVVPFDEATFKLGQKGGQHCYGCQQNLINSDSQSNLHVRCPKCHQHFCFDCDIYIHESLHNCPGCEDERSISS